MTNANRERCGRFGSTVLLAIAVLAVTDPAAATDTPSSFSFSYLTLPSDAMSITGINDQGQIVGTTSSCNLATTSPPSFIYDLTTGQYTEIPPQGPVRPYTCATAINNAGVVPFSSADAGFTAAEVELDNYLYTLGNGSVSTLAFLGTASCQYSVAVLNNAGLFGGFSSPDTCIGVGFIYNSFKQTYRAIDGPGHNAETSSVVGLNDFGLASVSINYQPYLYQYYSGKYVSVPVAGRVNNSGWILYYAATASYALYDVSSGQSVPIVDPAGGTLMPTALNNNNVVVGGYSRSGTSYNAFVATPTALLPQSKKAVARVLWHDPATGVMRHADAGYEIAKECAREHKLDLPGVL